MGILLSRGRWIGARVNGDALAVGCGEGELPALLEPEGVRVVEIEPGRAADLPYEDASFDTVLLGDFLAERINREPPLAEARRVLRPGGRLIVVVPYAGTGPEDDLGISLGALIGELNGFAVKEIEVQDEHVWLLAERAREKSRAVVWRRALGTAERRLAEREAMVETLRASASDLEARHERAERALDDIRGNVERLEMALAAATHQRDREEEAARLASAGVEALEQRLEQLQRQGEKERREAERRYEDEIAALQRHLGEVRAGLEVREQELQTAQAGIEALEQRLEQLQRQGEKERREAERRYEDEIAALQRHLGEVRAGLEVREQELQTAQAGIESRDRRLAAGDEALRAREAEMQRFSATVRRQERGLAAAKVQLEKSQARAEHFRSSLVSLRGGRSYRLMRILWRLRRPFRRGPRDPVEPGAGDEDPGPPAAPTAPSDPRPVAAVSTPPSRLLAAQPGEQRERLVVASILDEMSAACFGPECDLLPLALNGWREQLDGRRPDLLLVESAWNGNDGEWQYRIARYPRKDLAGLPALRELIAGCRERGIPTVFWNKEDPVHFERFAEAAALFDHVFTTDARCVERYQALGGANRTVASLPFAAQPRIHNPAAVVPERSASPCFAGAWYRDRHPDRRRALEALLDAARPYGLVIYDRSFGGEDGAFGFPERFQPHVLGGLPYERILDVYKSHRVFLNANSVVDSPTMCSRRVFELAACDTAILSTPGAALGRLFPHDTIVEAGDGATAAEALQSLLDDPAARRRRTRAARRAVFAEHTYADRLATIAETAGLDSTALRHRLFAPPAVAQAGPAPSNGASADSAEHPWQLVVQPGISLSEPALVDLAAAATYADADVVGCHPANGGPAVEHRRVPGLDPRALLIRRELIEARGCPTGSTEEVRAQLRRWSDQGVRLYAADADLL